MDPRTGAETALYQRWSGLLNFVFQAGRPTDQPVLPSGTTAIYNDPIGFGLSCIGLPPTDPTNVVSADITRLAGRQYYPFLDLGEYRMIRTIVGSFVDVNESAQDRSQQWATLGKMAQDRADDLEQLLKGYLLPYSYRGVSGSLRQGVPITARFPRFQPGAGRFGGRYW